LAGSHIWAKKCPGQLLGQLPGHFENCKLKI
jgi:hypothetical protein